MKKNSKLTSRLNLLYVIAIIPLILFGAYKNILFIINRSDISILLSLKMLALLFMGVSGAIIGISLKSLKNNKRIRFKDLYEERETLIEVAIMAMMLPLKTSPFIVFLVTLIFSILKFKSRINKVALTYVVVFAINEILHLNVFGITSLLTNPIQLRWTDLLIGLGDGGICSTSIIFILIGLVVLCFNPIYKKEIAISSVY